MTDIAPTEHAEHPPATDVVDRSDRICVIGAGSSGLTAAKNLREHGFDVDVIEREDDVGGNWNFGKPNSRVYETTHMISSKPFTQYPDFPMPDEAPDYLHHSDVLAYLRRYFEHFGLDEVTEFGTSVDRVEPAEPGGWHVTVSTDARTETRRYASVVVANGHNWFPKQPTYPGQEEFTGEIVHSADYKSADQLRDKRVLVVGAGNTGCDIAVDAARSADRCFHSTRRAYWYAPKYSFGKPSDQVSDVIFSLRLPARLTQALFEATAKIVVGRYERFGLPTPDHHFLETHPIVNQELLFFVGHGEVDPVGDIARFDGDTVVFTDGRREPVDLVVFATGYLIRFPFLKDDVIGMEDGRPHLYRHVFHPTHDDLFVIGLIQPDSGQFNLVHWQSVAVARYLQARDVDPATAAAFREQVVEHLDERSDAGVAYLDSTRHYVEVEHQAYLRDLRDIIRTLG